MKKTERQSNFELLRIIAIIMIIIHHIFVHAIKYQLEGPLIYGCGEYFNNFYFYKKLILADYAYSFGKIAVDLFILISGYFLCSSKKIDLLKISKKLIGQLLFITIGIVIASYIHITFINHSFIGSQSVLIFNTEYWFIGYYFLIVLLGKLFINKYINKLDKNKYTILLVILFSIISFSFTAGTLSGIFESSKVILTGIFLYLLGGYLKKYNPFKNIKSFVFILLIILTFVMMAISYKNRTMSDINSSLGNECYYQKIEYYSENLLPCLVLSISLFELFSRLKMKSNKIINYIASSTLIVYILHDNEYIRMFFRKIDWIKPYHDNIFKFILLIVLTVVAVFTTGVLLQMIYDGLVKIFKNEKMKKLFMK